MSIPGSASPLFLSAAAAAAPSALQIDRSLRFNSADSAYLNRTPSSTGNRKTWTWSGWVKKAGLGTQSFLFASLPSNLDNYVQIYFSTDQLIINTKTSGNTATSTKTAGLFRDPSAWFHVVVAIDTTATGNSGKDRLKVYINGRLLDDSDYQTDGRASIALNSDLRINSTDAHHIGKQGEYSNTYANVYLADVHFIDGQALAASDFGEYDDNNVWQPKEFTGSYGTAYSNFATNPGSYTGSAANLFDSDTATGWENTHASDYATVDLTLGGTTSGLAFSTSFEMGGIFGDNHILEIDHAGGTYTYGGNPGTVFGYLNFSSSLLSPITAIRFKKKSGSAGAPKWTAIRVDGTIVTDSGINSFHLDFSDNSSDAALGTDSSGNSNTWTVNNLSGPGGDADYASMVTQGSDGGYNAGSEAATAFDGSLTTAPNTSAANNNGNITFTPSPSISHTTSVRAYWKWGNSGATYSYNGGSNTSITASGWITLASGSGTFTSLNTNRDGDGNFFSAIEIDGTILITSTGADNDSLIDTPTNYDAASGNNGGNYATLNPLNANLNSTTISQGNLTWVKTSASVFAIAYGTIGVNSGKYYYEATVNSYSGNFNIGWNNAAGGPFADADTNAAFYSLDGGVIRQRVNTTSSTIVASGKATSTGIIGMAIDCDNNTVSFYHDNSLQYTVTGMAADTYFPRIYVDGGGNASNVDFNFGQRPFAYTPPTGYLSLCTQNLTDPTIANGSTAMDVALWDGDGNATKTVTTSFSPGFVWAKSRTVASNHQLSDVVRGNGKVVFSNTTGAEGDYSTFGGGGISSLGTNQFVISQGSSTNNNLNTNNSTGVAWYWDAGTGSPVSNTDGSITSSVRANPSAGFSIVTWTGNSGTVGHGLNAAPGLILTKIRNQSSAWPVQHSYDTSQFLTLNSTDAASSDTTRFGAAPTSSVFSVGSWWNSSSNGVAYCFAPVEGYSKFGSYTGNSSADGPFVYTGFRPRFLLIKTTANISGNWYVLDTKRDPHNVMALDLYANDSAAESTVTTNQLDILSNGFKLRGTGGGMNGSSHTLIYAAFAEHPFKAARAR